MLNEIVVKGLFGLFNYTIQFPKEHAVMILTGPNGYGKTTLLRILHALSTKNILFFYNLVFTEIAVVFENAEKITLKKHLDKLTVLTGSKENVKPLSQDEFLKRINTQVSRRMPFQQFDENHWIDRRTDAVLPTEEFFAKLVSGAYPEIERLPLFEELPIINDVYLIREQRLLRKSSEFESDEMSIRKGVRRVGDSYIDTVEEYAKNLKQIISVSLTRHSEIAQQLDGSFPQRLFAENQQITKIDFDHRFEPIKAKQKILTEFELLAIQEDTHPTYSEKDARALKVYLDDTEIKLQAFDDLLLRLSLFTSILNERRFAFKKIQIKKECGFAFVTDRGDMLSLKELSSGEKQEVILLYELLFKIKPKSLVLIDEPEISLHIAWQKEFLNDLQKIANLQKFKVVVATHSPQIINGKWDLMVDLEKIAEKIIHA